MQNKGNNSNKYTVKNKNNKDTRNDSKKFKKKNVPYNNVKKASEVENEEITNLLEQYINIKDVKEITTFKDLPLSRKTLKGLKENKFKVPTDIQKGSIGYALQGRDILGAAITGSGKTLAFLIPILEHLYVNKWNRLDGIGAIIISPTRELAYQIFETLKKVGIHHEFSAGLIIGGKNLKFETKRMDQCNIVICTPGRLLQHMDENPLFNCTSTRILVLDEADRCLDMGFEETMNSIIENLPEARQSLLFSATQTKSVKDLARLSLKSPVSVAPSEEADLITPASLQQNYVVIELEDKITMIWSFIKNHLKHKCMIFLSSCKQVKYIYEIFCKLKPGVSMLALYGTLHQDRRTKIYDEFCAKNHCVLFATDIASRGLHFPVVNWVIHLDCPEDAVAYIHRAGRTARHNAKGESLLVLTPTEVQPMLKELQSKKIEIQEISIDPKRLFSPRAKVEAFLAQNTELKATAQRAFVAYIKSVYLMKNKSIFNVENINIDTYARSLGLMVTPRVRFLQRLQKNKKLGNSDEKDSADEDIDEVVGKRGGSKPKAKTAMNFFNDSDYSDDEDAAPNLFSVRRVLNSEVPDADEDDEELQPLEEKQSRKSLKPKTKAAVAKKIGKKNIIANKKVSYDEDGNEIINTAKKMQSEMGKEYEATENENGIDIEMAKKLLKEEDKFDKQRFKALLKARNREKKEKLLGKKDDVEGGEYESDSDAGPDLSWLPDPDKIYKNKDENSSDGSNGMETEDPIHRPPKKLIEKRKKSKKSDDDDEEEQPTSSKKRKKKHRATIPEDLPLNAAEQLAMRLLGNS